MTVYWQHVGVAGATRDFPRTIGTQHTGLIHFNWQDVEGYLTHLGENERGLIQSQIENYAPDGFQIWGIPSGAKNVLRDLEVGDYLLLLETTGAGGQFTYTGRVIARPSKECQDLSNHLWGEYRFPLIVFLKGELTSYYWLSFFSAQLQTPYFHHISESCLGILRVKHNRGLPLK